jgi:aminopeptidase-like protein
MVVFVVAPATIGGCRVVSRGGDMSKGERGCGIVVRCIGEIMQAERTA